MFCAPRNGTISPFFSWDGWRSKEHTSASTAASSYRKFHLFLPPRETFRARCSRKRREGSNAYTLVRQIGISGRAGGVFCVTFCCLVPPIQDSQPDLSWQKAPIYTYVGVRPFLGDVTTPIRGQTDKLFKYLERDKIPRDLIALATQLSQKPANPGGGDCVDTHSP